MGEKPTGCEQLFRSCFTGPLLPAGKRRRMQSYGGDIGLEELPTARSTTPVPLESKGDEKSLDRMASRYDKVAKEYTQAIAGQQERNPRDQEILLRFSTNRWQTSWARYYTGPLLAVSRRSGVNIDRVFRSYSESNGE